MTELVSLRDVPDNVKIRLLEELKYESDGEIVLKGREPHLDKYTDEPIKLNNMLILPGSTIILDNNPLSVSSFLEEYGDVL